MVSAPLPSLCAQLRELLKRSIVHNTPLPGPASVPVSCALYKEVDMPDETDPHCLDTSTIVPLTEADVRRIIQDELRRILRSVPRRDRVKLVNVASIEQKNEPTALTDNL